MPLAKDLHPSPEEEERKEGQMPGAEPRFLLHGTGVKCAGCCKTATVFSHTAGCFPTVSLQEGKQGLQKALQKAAGRKDEWEISP